MTTAKVVGVAHSNTKEADVTASIKARVSHAVKAENAGKATDPRAASSPARPARSNATNASSTTPSYLKPTASSAASASQANGANPSPARLRPAPAASHATGSIVASRTVATPPKPRPTPARTAPASEPASSPAPRAAATPPKPRPPAATSKPSTTHMAPTTKPTTQASRATPKPANAPHPITGKSSSLPAPDTAKTASPVVRSATHPPKPRASITSTAAQPASTVAVQTTNSGKSKANATTILAQPAPAATTKTTIAAKRSSTPSKTAASSSTLDAPAAQMKTSAVVPKTPSAPPLGALSAPPPVIKTTRSHITPLGAKSTSAAPITPQSPSTAAATNRVSALLPNMSFNTFGTPTLALNLGGKSTRLFIADASTLLAAVADPIPATPPANVQPQSPAQTVQPSEHSYTSCDSAAAAEALAEEKPTQRSLPVLPPPPPQRAVTPLSQASTSVLPTITAHPQRTSSPSSQSVFIGRRASEAQNASEQTDSLAPILPPRTANGRRSSEAERLSSNGRKLSISPEGLPPVLLPGARSRSRPTTSSSSHSSISPYQPYPAVTPKVRGDWILPNYANRDCWKDYEPVRKLGSGSFATTYLAKQKRTDDEYAVKVIRKGKLGPEEIQDIQREVQILHHLAGHPNVIMLKDVYEDKYNICIVMELCSGGELFNAIVRRGCFSERDAAELMRTIVSVAAHCHSMGVIHRDFKPENFLFSARTKKGKLKAIDFGLSTFFHEGELLDDIVGSAYYVAPEVLNRRYSKEADIWSCGVILYILLCGYPPFQGSNDDEVFASVLHDELDLSSNPWPFISDEAKDCVRHMLERDPAQRATAREILQHDWLREHGCARDAPLQLEVLDRIKKFSAMNHLKQEALKVIARNMPMDEISGMRQLFIEMDKDRSGHISVEEFTAALRKKGSAIPAMDIQLLMEDADVNGDGMIDYEEFLAATINQGKLHRKKYLKAAFRYFDTDGSGTISKDELVAALAKLDVSHAQIDEILRTVDKDGNGEIDYREFVSMMKNM